MDKGKPSILVEDGVKYTFADYTSTGTKIWANVKTIDNNLNAYWVWIPRFAYKLESGTANVILVDKNNKPIDSGKFGDSLPTGYKIHEAFNQKDGLMGIWFAKYDPTKFVDESGAEKMKIDNGAAWTQIDVSQSYARCEELNSTSSTLGTSNLKAHLTTDYDWSAMAIFSVSQYGETTTDTPKNTSTNKNNSGIYDIGSNTVQTTTLLNNSTSTSTYLYGLYNEDGSLKKYVNKINTTTGKEYDINGNETGRIAISYLTNNGTKTWLGATTYSGTDAAYPVCIKRGLFGYSLGNHNMNFEASGVKRTTVTFRPVIWN